MKLFMIGIFLILCDNFVFSQSIFTLKGKIYETNTMIELLESRVEILSAHDSIVIASTIASRKYRSGNDTFYSSEYNIDIPKKEGKYIIRVSKKGYETTYLSLDLRNLYQREFSRVLPNIYLRKELCVALKEVTVTASKVKFYLNGDTIVYNADAFQLSEGSMLDALIRQLPGAELRGDKIYVNGRFIESLMLNGKDFFKGNNGVLLNNLPNYMVSNISVYEKLGNDSEFLGQEVVNDTRYVMDVKLKKQYAIGLSGNVELGGGSAEKYLARLFAMRFTSHSRIATYFNANNLNDVGKPGEHTNWSPSFLRGGILTRQIGGIDYNVDDKKGKYKLNGNVQFCHDNNDIKENTYQTFFLPEGDMYSRIRNNEERRNFTVETNHRFYFEWTNANIELTPDAKYTRYDNRGNYAAATFNQNVLKKNDEMENCILGEKIADACLPFIVNSNLRESKDCGYEWQTGMTVKSRIKFNRIPDYLTLYACGTYCNSSAKTFDNNNIGYYSQGDVISADFRNRYFDSKPTHRYDIQSKVTYTYVIKRGIMLDLSYSFNRNYSDTWSNLYLLSKLDEWSNEIQPELGWLPSFSVYMRTIDAANSYQSKLGTNTSTIEPFLVWKKETEKSIWKGQLSMPLSLQTRSLTYSRGDIDTTFTKRNILLNVYSSYIEWLSKNRKYDVKLQYALSSKSPDMNMFMDIFDTTDPLNITTGNPDLQTTLSHQIIASFIRMYPQKRIMWAVEGVMKPVQNAIAMGYTYNKNTGGRTFRPSNVNGCWSGNFNVGISAPLDMHRKLNAKLMLGTGYVHSVDLIGLEESETVSRSSVGTHTLSEKLQLEYTVGKSQIGIISECTWRKSTSDRKDFTTVNAAELKNGLTAQIQLPLQINIDTDLTLYSRRGYTYSNMNTDDLVWNARLSRPFMKGKLLIQLDGYDILKQLSNIYMSVNVQGIVETHTNIIPQYVLLHLTYRFSKSPKARE